MNSEGINNVKTMPQLVRHIIDHWKSEQAKALKDEEDQKEKLSTELRKEKDLTAKLKTARSIAEKMELEYLAIETRIQGEKQAMIETASIKEEDIKSGKITLAEFLKVGRTKAQIYEKSVEQTMKELNLGLIAIRNKQLQILNFEKELLECQTKIRYLIIEPGRILQKVLKDLAQFAEREVGFFLEEVHSSKAALEQVKGKLLLTQGRSLGPGHSWSRLSLKQAYKLQFNPILPIDAIPSLKSKLESYKDADIVSVTYFLRTKGIDVSSVYIGDKK